MAETSGNGSTTFRHHVNIREGDTYGLLLALILVTFLVMALLDRGGWSRFVLAVMLGAVLLLTLQASHVRRRLKLLGLVLVSITALIALGQAIAGSNSTDGTAYGEFLLLLIAPVVIVARILRHPVVDAQTILGAICAYLMIGMAFAGVYAGIETFETVPFFAQTAHPTHLDFLYFSFVTMTTTGFGDLTAESSTGRVLVMLEALLGQIFLVTLVARLVSMYGMARPARAQPGGARSTPEE
jgi:uncharacterized membrane protein